MFTQEEKQRYDKYIEIVKTKGITPEMVKEPKFFLYLVNIDVLNGENYENVREILTRIWNDNYDYHIEVNDENINIAKRLVDLVYSCDYFPESSESVLFLVFRDVFSKSKEAWEYWVAQDYKSSSIDVVADSKCIKEKDIGEAIIKVCKNASANGNKDREYAINSICQGFLYNAAIGYIKWDFGKIMRYIKENAPEIYQQFVCYVNAWRLNPNQSYTISADKLKTAIEGFCRGTK